MKGEAVAKRYALALNQICKTEEEWENIKKELIFILNLISENNELKEFMKNKFFPKKLKINVVEKISEKSNISEKIRRFLILLVEKGRFELLPLVLSNFEELWERKNKIYKMEVISSINLNEEEKKSILEILSKVKKGKIQAEFKIDPSILGGILIKERHKILDLSLKGNLERLKNKIIEGEGAWK